MEPLKSEHSDYKRFSFAMSILARRRKVSSKETRDLITDGECAYPDPVMHSTSEVIMMDAEQNPSYYVTIHATFDVTLNSKFLGGYFVMDFLGEELGWVQYDADHFGDFLNAVVAHGS